MHVASRHACDRGALVKARAWLNFKRGSDQLVDVEVLGMPRERVCPMPRTPNGHTTLRTTLVHVVGESAPREIATERIQGAA